MVVVTEQAVRDRTAVLGFREMRGEINRYSPSDIAEGLGNAFAVKDMAASVVADDSMLRAGIDELREIYLKKIGVASAPILIGGVLMSLSQDVIKPNAESYANDGDMITHDAAFDLGHAVEDIGKTFLIGGMYGAGGGAKAFERRITLFTEMRGVPVPDKNTMLYLTRDARQASVLWKEDPTGEALLIEAAKRVKREPSRLTQPAWQGDHQTQAFLADGADFTIDHLFPVIYQAVTDHTQVVAA